MSEDLLDITHYRSRRCYECYESQVGIVSLPGMMTGQLLAGTSPIEAVKYQIVIMFLIASGTALGTVSVVLLSFRRLFNEDHQFLDALLANRRETRRAKG
jgi:putative ABC transport system permease protein